MCAALPSRSSTTTPQPARKVIDVPFSPVQVAPAVTAICPWWTMAHARPGLNVGHRCRRRAAADRRRPLCAGGRTRHRMFGNRLRSAWHLRCEHRGLDGLRDHREVGETITASAAFGVDNFQVHLKGKRQLQPGAMVVRRAGRLPTHHVSRVGRGDGARTRHCDDAGSGTGWPGLDDQVSGAQALEPVG